jgi:putative peptide zinc metalloprotease protein
LHAVQRQKHAPVARNTGATSASDTQPAGEDPRALVSGTARIELRALSITPDGEFFMVGDLARGEFIQVPPIAITVISALREGHTVDLAADLARAEVGQDVDAVDFVQTLCEVGFVASINGIAVSVDGPRLRDGGRAGAALARLARPFYTSPAWACYGVLFTGCVLLLTAVPWFRPRYSQWFFLPNPLLSVALLSVITMPLVMAHEVAHWLGARIQGVPARITLTRRYYLLVAQTDLSGLWALPRRRRYPALLAGMALDIVVVALLMAARGLQYLGWWHPAPTLSRLLAALVLLQVLGISFQFALFLRTDLYAVLITSLGCLNLTRISRLRMARRYRHLSAAEEQELESADPRDQAAARWYGWVQLGGMLVALFYFTVYFVPATVHTLSWLTAGFAGSSPGSRRFWEYAGASCVLAAPVIIPPYTYLRDRRRAQALGQRTGGGGGVAAR